MSKDFQTLLYYPAEFESLLGVTDGRDLAALSLVDRRTMDEVVD